MIPILIPKLRISANTEYWSDTYSDQQGNITWQGLLWLNECDWVEMLNDTDEDAVFHVDGHIFLIILEAVVLLYYKYWKMFLIFCPSILTQIELDTEILDMDVN